MDFYSEKKVPQIESLDDLINVLRLIFESDNIDVNYVQDVLFSYKSNPNDWRKYAHFDKHRYTRNLVDSGNGKYNLMLVCWSEGQGSHIHDHADAHCFMKMLSGNLHEMRFEWPNLQKPEEEVNNNCIETEKMRCIGETQIKLNDVAYINDSIGLHRVENRSHTLPAVSLHLYCPPFSKCQTFDQRTGANTQVKVTFFSKHGMRTPYKTSKSKHKLDLSLINSGKELIENENETAV